MELQLTRDAFFKALSRVHTVVDRVHMTPIVRNLLLQSEEGRVRLEGTDLVVSVRTYCPAEVIEGGVITVNARTLYDVVNELPAGAELLLRVDARGRMRITSGRAKFEVATLPADQFPKIPQAEGPYRFAVAVPVLREMLAKTHFAMSDDVTRYTLNGVLFHVVPDPEGGCGHIRVVATDSHRLASVDREMEGLPSEEREVIIPKKAVHEIRRLLDESDDALEMILDDNFIQLLRPEVMMVAKLVEGRYPDYRQVIPRNQPMRLDVEREVLLGIVRRVSVLSNEKSHGIRLEIAGDTMRFNSNNPEQGEAEEEMQVKLEGGDVLMVGFSARYLREFLSVMEGEIVSFLLNNEELPVLLTDPYQLGTQFVLMPMRV
ncbi:MAG: DNA polymerase III subunit beta [Magnetococcales bacterium]|nr:DNA polymerase III subunit beta [Magnetococcales bacterium]